MPRLSLNALKNKSLDAVIGAGVLEPADIQELTYDESFNVQHTEPILNAVIIMNSDTDINTRKTVVHAINKGTLMDELGGVEEELTEAPQRYTPM